MLRKFVIAVIAGIVGWQLGEWFLPEGFPGLPSDVLKAVAAEPIMVFLEAGVFGVAVAVFADVPRKIVALIFLVHLGVAGLFALLGMSLVLAVACAALWVWSLAAIALYARHLKDCVSAKRDLAEYMKAEYADYGQNDALLRPFGRWLARQKRHLLSPWLRPKTRLPQEWWEYHDVNTWGGATMWEEIGIGYAILGASLLISLATITLFFGVSVTLEWLVRDTILWMLVTSAITTAIAASAAAFIGYRLFRNYIAQAD